MFENMSLILCQLHFMLFNEPLSTTLTICANKILYLKKITIQYRKIFSQTRFCRKVYPSVMCCYY